MQSAETRIDHSLSRSKSTPHFSTATPQHRKVKDMSIRSNMEIDYHLFKHYPDERYIANLPWVTAQKRRRAGLPSSSDTVANSECVHRSSYKLKSIDPLGRSSAEIEAWHKVLAHSATQARVRAVQMHLNCVTALSALPLVLSCCEKRPVFGASAALRNLHTYEFKRDWIYDTGAGTCLIG